MRRPGPRLEDVAARRVDRPGVPVVELVRLSRRGRFKRPPPYAAALPLVRDARRAAATTGRGPPGRAS